MATDLRGYSVDEVLNKVLNTSNDSIQVDIVSGAEYAEDSAHTSADTGNFVLGVRNDTLAALGGADGDYVPFQMNASGALYVEVATGGGEDAVYADDADWTDGSSKHMLVGGLYQSSPQSITDGDVGPLQVNSNGNLIKIHKAVIQQAYKNNNFTYKFQLPEVWIMQLSRIFDLNLPISSKKMNYK